MIRLLFFTILSLFSLQALATNWIWRIQDNYQWSAPSGYREFIRTIENKPSRLEDFFFINYLSHIFDILSPTENYENIGLMQITSFIDDVFDISKQSILENFPGGSSLQSLSSSKVMYDLARIHGPFRPDEERLGILKAIYGSMDPTTGLSHSMVVIHHTTKEKNKRPDEVIKSMIGDGFTDIGYHFLIDSQGNIYEGRSLFLQGAHAVKHSQVAGYGPLERYGGQSSKTFFNYDMDFLKIGIAFIGDYNWRDYFAARKAVARSKGGDPSQIRQRAGEVQHQPDEITENQIEALVELLTWLNEKLNVNRLAFHGQIVPKGCPGENVAKAVIKRMNQETPFLKLKDETGEGVYSMPYSFAPQAMKNPWKYDHAVFAANEGGERKYAWGIPPKALSERFSPSHTYLSKFSSPFAYDTGIKINKLGEMAFYSRDHSAVRSIYSLMDNGTGFNESEGPELSPMKMKATDFEQIRDLVAP